MFMHHIRYSLWAPLLSTDCPRVRHTHLVLAEEDITTIKRKPDAWTLRHFAIAPQNGLLTTDRKTSTAMHFAFLATCSLHLLCDSSGSLLRQQASWSMLILTLHYVTTSYLQTTSLLPLSQVTCKQHSHRMLPSGNMAMDMGTNIAIKMVTRMILHWSISIASQHWLIFHQYCREGLYQPI